MRRIYLLLFLILAAGASAVELQFCLRPFYPREQFVHFTEVANRSHIVVDESYDRTVKGRWTAVELQRFKGRQGRNLVLCHFSIGTAADCRGYWKSEWKETPPPFLLEKIPQAKGMYRVNYWDEQWQSILLEELERMIALGYDGVCLDMVNCFGYFEGQAKKIKAVNPATKRTYRKDMALLIMKLAKAARKKTRKFQFFLQNGEALLEDRDLLHAINGLILEDLFSNGRKKNDITMITQRMSGVWKAKVARKTCFIVEYIPMKKAMFVIDLAQRNALDMLMTDRSLSDFGKTYKSKPMSIGN